MSLDGEVQLTFFLLFCDAFLHLRFLLLQMVSLFTEFEYGVFDCSSHGGATMTWWSEQYLVQAPGEDPAIHPRSPVAL